MNIYALICTRSDKPGKSLEKLTETLSGWGIQVRLLVDKPSIFEAHYEAVKDLMCYPEDIIILCHDDIEILAGREHFFKCLSEAAKPSIGFIGVAGTTELASNGVWWDREVLSKGKGRGSVCHAEDLHPTYFGPTGEVVIMDGLFLAARAGNLTPALFSKPDMFVGNWDFYDIMYCYRMHSMGLINMVVPLLLRHHSRGELVGRDGWNENRLAFCKKYLKGKSYGN
jgi:hypothetical protein